MSAKEGINPLQSKNKAPLFTLKVTPDQSISLSELFGKPIVLIFYPADFSPVCKDELLIFNKSLPDFKKFDTQLLGISVDNVWSHLVFAEDRDIHFPLLSDFHPKGEVGKKYGVYNEEEGQEKRAIFVIDKNGVIKWSYVSPVGISPDVKEVLKALEK